MRKVPGTSINVLINQLDNDKNLKQLMKNI